SKDEKFFVSQAWLESDCYLKIHGFDKDLYIYYSLGFSLTQNRSSKTIVRDEKLEELKEFRIKGDKFLHFPFLFSKMHKMKMHPRAGHSEMEDRDEGRA
ncbi:hypothetical protein Tco_1009053, partial [Tanacetum coccineum]